MNVDLWSESSRKKLKFQSREDVLKFLTAQQPVNPPHEFHLGDGSRFLFIEHPFGMMCMAAMTEVPVAMLADWKGSGVRMTPIDKRNPRASNIATLCAVRELVSAGVQLQDAARVGRALSKPILGRELINRLCV